MRQRIFDAAWRDGWGKLLALPPPSRPLGWDTLAPRVANIKNSAQKFRAYITNCLAHARIRCISPPMSVPVQVSRTPECRSIRGCVRPASEKRQGTKSREVIAGGAACAMGIEAVRGRCGAVIVRRG